MRVLSVVVRSRRGGVDIMKRLVLAILVVLSLAAAANAQTFRGAINGTVTDPSGAVIPNAQVKATESATGIDHNTVTTSEGAFSLQDIPLGFYKVSVTASGFPVYTVDKVEVTAGTIYTLPVKLSLQQQATTVEVSAAAVSLDTTTATQSTTLTSDVVQDVPLNGRDFTQLIGIKPGFAGYNIGGFGSINGTRGNQVNWQIDGVDNNDFWHNIPAVNQGGVSGVAGIILPIDSIEEFSAQTQSGPEGGRNAGGTVNVVTKSGGNALHGSAYYFWRNEYLAAASPFLPSGTKAPPLRDENYGFSLGGPIRKNKLFYFLSFEKQQYVFGLSGVATEPSDAWVALATDLLKNPGNKYGSYAPVSASAFSTAAVQPSGFWPRSGPGNIAALPATLNNFFSPGAPKISIDGFEKVGLTQPAGRNDITWHVTDIVSYSVGAHQLRFGGELRQAHVNEFYHTGETGKFGFTGLVGPWAASCSSATPPPGCAALISAKTLANAESLADFLAGDVASSSIAVGNPERFVVVNAFNLYFQDDWQVTRRLNFSFGTRYEYFGPLHSNKKDIANFIPGKGLLIQGNGLDSLFEPDKNNFAPRLGFAYPANQKGDLVVRG